MKTYPSVTFREKELRSKAKDLAEKIKEVISTFSYESLTELNTDIPIMRLQETSFGGINKPVPEESASKIEKHTDSTASSVYPYNVSTAISSLGIKDKLVGRLSKSFLISKRNIVNVKVDAIVNIVNSLDSQHDEVIPGRVFNLICEIAGTEYSEGLNNFLSTTKAESFVTDCGNLTSCRKIINVIVDMNLSTQNSKGITNIIRKIARNILRQSERADFKSIAVSLVDTGDNFNQEAISRYMKELANGLFDAGSPLERIILCEKSEDKLAIIQEVLATIRNAQQQEEIELSYNWQWYDQGAGFWKNFDAGISRKINESYIGLSSHIELFASGLDLDSTSGKFKYYIDFTKSMMINKRTQAERKIRKTSSPSEEIFYD